MSEDTEFLDNLTPFYKVVYLLMQGWTDLVEIKDFLDLSEVQMKDIVEQLSLRGIISTHTIH